MVYVIRLPQIFRWTSEKNEFKKVNNLDNLTGQW